MPQEQWTALYTAGKSFSTVQRERGISRSFVEALKTIDGCSESNGGKVYDATEGEKSRGRGGRGGVDRSGGAHHPTPSVY